MAAKPDDKYEDPQDVAAIAWAEKNMGDFKLKTDENYVVPEHQRINADKKRRQVLMAVWDGSSFLRCRDVLCRGNAVCNAPQMVLLEESVHSIKMGFNDRFLALRDLKRRIVDSVRARTLARAHARTHARAFTGDEGEPADLGDQR